MSDPRTAAGRAFLANEGAYVNLKADILAIEAEARAAALPHLDLLARAMAYVRDGHDAQWRDYIREADGLLAAIDVLRERLAPIGETDWQPHDGSIVYITRGSLTREPPGKPAYHTAYNRRRSKHAGYRTRCGIELWSYGWEPHQESKLIAVRRDVASRVARPCIICGAE